MITATDHSVVPCDLVARVIMSPLPMTARGLFKPEPGFLALPPETAFTRAFVVVHVDGLH